MRQAKGFGLKDIDEKNSTYNVGAEAAPATEEDAIFLDIIGDDSIPMQTAPLATKNTRKTQAYRAYKKLHRFFSIRRSVPLQEKSSFYELLSTMLDAGIPIIEAVKVFTEQTSHKYFKNVCQAITYQLEKGQSFSQALGEYRRIFPESETGMVEAAEATGRLSEVLERQSNEIESYIIIKGKIRSAMIYPTIVFFFVIAALYGMLRFVIPQMSELFTASNLELPALTQFLIDASDFVVNKGYLVIATAVAIFVALYLFGVSAPGKRLYHTLILKLPVLGEFQKSIYQSRFTRSLSNLLNAGVSVVNATEITARSIKNVVYKSKIKLLVKDVSQGIPIADSLKDSPYFSHLLVSMIAVGEKTAQIDSLTAKIADFYDRKVSNMAENFSKLIQPFIILIVGVMVGVVVLAIMLPMTKLIGGIDSL